MSYQDGSNNASAGAPQLPNLLSGYAVRPPWKVAGVDYAVGVPSGSGLKDWESISQPGVSVNAATHTVYVTGNNVTLNGVDFSLHGGSQLVIEGANNTTISNCNVVYGSALTSSNFLINAVSGSNITIEHCTIDGNGAVQTASSDQSSLISTGSRFTGTVTLTYNRLQNFIQHVLEYNGGTTLVYEYNLIYNGGNGPTGPHLNYLQWGSGTFGTATVEYNTTYQPTNPHAGGQGFQFTPNSGSISSFTLAHNTMIYAPDGAGLVDAANYVSGVTTSGQIYDNYINKGSGSAFFYTDPNAGKSNQYSGNVNLVTGAVIGSGTAPQPNNTPPAVSSSSPSSSHVDPGTTVTTTPKGTQSATSGSHTSNPAPPSGSKTISHTGASPGLIEVSKQYHLKSNTGADPALKYNGANVGEGKFGSWTPIAAVETSSGYDVAWKNTGTGQYTVWSTDRNGNYKGNLTGGGASGTSYALESLEPVFHQDLNRDGVIGPTQKVIQADGSTRLTEVANHHYNLDGSSGSDPTLKYRGTTVTVVQFGKWTPIGAIQTAGGFDVAWKNTGTGQYTVWSTDRNGNYKGNLTGGGVSRTSYALESLEPVFHQDLNRDGVTGVYAVPGTKLQIGNALTGTTESATIGRGATLELAAADSAAIRFASSTGTLRVDHSSTFTGKIFGFGGDGSVSGSDHIDLRDIKYGTIKDSYNNGTLTITDSGGHTARLGFSGSYSLGNFKFASDGSGGTIVYDPPVSPTFSNTDVSTNPLQNAPVGSDVALHLAALDSRDTVADTPLATQTTLGYSPDNNQGAGISPVSEGMLGANVALLGQFMAATFAPAGGDHGGTMALSEAAQRSDQSPLTIPHHA